MGWELRRVRAVAEIYVLNNMQNTEAGTARLKIVSTMNPSCAKLLERTPTIVPYGQTGTATN